MLQLKEIQLIRFHLEAKSSLASQSVISSEIRLCKLENKNKLHIFLI